MAALWPAFFSKCRTRTSRALVRRANGAIGRAVVDEDDFVVQTGQRRRQLGLQNRHVLFFVEERHDDGNRRRRLVIAHSGSVR